MSLCRASAACQNVDMAAESDSGLAVCLSSFSMLYRLFGY